MKSYITDQCASEGKHRVLLLLKRWKPPKQAYTQRRLVQPHYARASPPPSPSRRRPLRHRHAATVAATVAVSAPMPRRRRRRLVHEKGKPSTAALPWSKAWYSLYGDCLWCEVQESSPKGTWKHLCWATFGWWKNNACLLSGEIKIHNIILSSFNNCSQIQCPSSKKG